MSKSLLLMMNMHHDFFIEANAKRLDMCKLKKLTLTRMPVASYHPDVMIIDTNLGFGCLPGYEICRQLRGNEQTKI